MSLGGESRADLYNILSEALEVSRALEALLPPFEEPYLANQSQATSASSLHNSSSSSSSLEIAGADEDNMEHASEASSRSPKKDTSKRQ